jgi:hypothetical protein
MLFIASKNANILLVIESKLANCFKEVFTHIVKSLDKPVMSNVLFKKAAFLFDFRIEF